MFDLLTYTAASSLKESFSLNTATTLVLFLSSLDNNRLIRSSARPAYLAGVSLSINLSSMPIT